MPTSDWMLPGIRRLEKPRGCPVVDGNFLRGVVLWPWGPNTEEYGKLEIYVTHPLPRYLTRREAETLWVDLETSLGFIIAFREGSRLVASSDWKIEFDYAWKRVFGQNDGYEIVSQKITGENPGKFRSGESVALAVALNNVITNLVSGT